MKNDAVVHEQKYRDLIKRLNATYSGLGEEGLAQMTPLERYVLNTEKSSDLRVAKARQAEHGDELSSLRVEKLERETTDIAAYIKANDIKEPTVLDKLRQGIKMEPETPHKNNDYELDR